MINKGICLTAIFPEAMFSKEKLKEALRRSAETNFYTGVEYYFKGSDEDYKEIQGFIKELGLYSVFLAGYPMKTEQIDISARDEKVRRASVEYCKELVERAIKLGSDKILVLSGPVWAEKDEELLVQQFTKSIQELLAMQDTNANMPEISLEFFNTKGEPYLALGEFKTIKLLCEKLTGTNFGITYDFSHAAQLRMDIPSTVKALLPWIHHVHIANSVSKVKTSPLYGDKHPLFGVEDEDLSLEYTRELIQDFQKEGYFKNIPICSMEVIPREDHSEDWYFEETLKQARVIWKN